MCVCVYVCEHVGVLGISNSIPLWSIPPQCMLVLNLTGATTIHRPMFHTCILSKDLEQDYGLIVVSITHL